MCKRFCKRSGTRRELAREGDIYIYIYREREREREREGREGERERHTKI